MILITAGLEFACFFSRLNIRLPMSMLMESSPAVSSRLLCVLTTSRANVFDTLRRERERESRLTIFDAFYVAGRVRIQIESPQC